MRKCLPKYLEHVYSQEFRANLIPELCNLRELKHTKIGPLHKEAITTVTFTRVVYPRSRFGYEQNTELVLMYYG